MKTPIKEKRGSGSLTELPKEVKDTSSSTGSSGVRRVYDTERWTETHFDRPVTNQSSGTTLQIEEFERTKTKEIDNLYTPLEGVVSPLEVVYSDKFLKYRTQQLINSLIPDLVKWAEVGSEDGLIYISSIKMLLEKYARTLDSREENRLLIGTLQLIVHGDGWENYTSSQISSLIRELGRFSDGDVQKEQVNTFAKQLYRLGIGLL